MDIAEIYRLLENIVRQGTVAEIDVDTWRVRVESTELTSTWLRWNAQRAGDFSIWIPPSVGEQVWLLCFGGNPETAIIGGSLYSNDNPAPGASAKEIVITAPDGAKFHYDADAGALEVTGIKTAKISAEVKVTFDTPLVECLNHLKTRTFELTEGGTMKGNVTHSDGAMTSNGVQIDDHAHGKVQSGGSWTEGTQ